MSVRVRFAPSPTGFLHVGGARTALYNWLFARKLKGTFILRIEDTDEARSTEDSLLAIIDGLNWLGLDWDEGPLSSDLKTETGEFGSYFQMRRSEIYRKHLDLLVESGKAYPCFCSKEELEEMRNRALLLKRPPKYDGRCRKLDPKKRDERLEKGEAHVYRFARPSEGTVQFNDVVKGQVRFESEELDDFVIVKSSGIPTFMFAGAVDDHLMKISHVIRGDDHLSNTPRQLQLCEAFGWKDVPIFAHISMIHGADGTRLSKRHGATSVEEFRRSGFLPEVMLNYLALLGWSTSDSQQLFDPADHFKELVEKFELERCQKSPAVFDMEKLRWMNGIYIRTFTPDELLNRTWPFLVQAGLVWEKTDDKAKDYIKKALLLEQEKLVHLSDAPKLIDFFIFEEVKFDEEAVNSVLNKEGVETILKGVKGQFEKMPNLTADETEKICREFAKANNIKNAQVFHPVRVAVSGRTKGPSLFHMLEVLGKDRVLKRMETAIKRQEVKAV
ncbi:MAG: glutamate--tRNA ligase [Elusimicrobia bacterium]|nr:glutamate--tRNA ligase [Candidatus Obscuribacterium magneticum]